MKTIFCVSYRDFQSIAKKSPPKVHELNLPYDWHVLRAAAVYAAVLHAMRKMKNAPKGDFRVQAYATLATAFAEMLHRLGDQEEDDEGFMRERTFDWTSSDDHAAMVRDLKIWAETGEAKYRVSAWAGQWEPMNKALRQLEDAKEPADITEVFRGAFTMEFLSIPDSPINSRHEALLRIFYCAQQELIVHEDTHFLVKPFGACYSLLNVLDADALYELQYFLKEVV